MDIYTDGTYIYFQVANSFILQELFNIKYQFKIVKSWLTEFINIKFITGIQLFSVVYNQTRDNRRLIDEYKTNGILPLISSLNGQGYSISVQATKYMYINLMRSLEEFITTG